MTFSDYLADYYYSLNQLASATDTSIDTLGYYQDIGLLPKPSFTVQRNIEVSSFYGIDSFTESLEYYARGYQKWVQIIKKHPELTSAAAFVLFSQQYSNTVSTLLQQGIVLDETFFDEFDDHLKSQWQQFLAGNLGAITANGLIRECAEFSIACYVIDNLSMAIDNRSPEKEEAQQLSLAIKLIERATNHCDVQNTVHNRRSVYLKMANTILAQEA